MEIDSEKVLKIARLSRIKITDSECTDIQKDLNRIVEFVKKLSEINIDEIDEFNFGKAYLEDMREDSVTTNDNAEKILENTENKSQGFFTVPKIVE